VGQPADGGLFMPENLPQVDFEKYPDGLSALAKKLLALFFNADPLLDDIAAMVDETYAFPAPLVPMTHLGPAYLLELFHGPTASFKDFGARFLASAWQRIHQANGPTVTVLVATSGDTGGAVAAAFHRRPFARVVLMFPDGRVSPLQERQLTCWGDNVISLSVAGTFDDCQRLAKMVLADTALRTKTQITTANSINIGRLLPQMTYYAAAALEHFRRTGEKLGFIVPTGNVGNVFAATMARAVGFPIGSICIATNANDVIPKFLAGSNEVARPVSLSTLANAMDVATPSNLERLNALYPNLKDFNAAIYAEAVQDNEILDEIRQTYAESGEIICPHTACGVRLLRRLRAAESTETFAVAATAHPAKFPEIITQALGNDVIVPLPPSLAAILEKPVQIISMPNDYDALQEVLLQK